MSANVDEQEDPWWTTPQIAAALGESTWLVRKSLADARRADELYGPGNWSNRGSLLSSKRVFRARRSAVLRLKARADNAAENGTPSE